MELDIPSTAEANISWLTEDLATGGDLSFDPVEADGQVEDILNRGITYITDMREEANDWKVWEQHEHVEYLWLPTDDRTGHVIPDHLFDLAVKQARRAAKQQRKMLVHCHMGINRGPSTAYAILLDRGYDVIEAFDLIRAKRTEAGIVYAPDALRAHHARRLTEARFGFDAQAEREALQQHMASIWTPEERSRIRHIIRGKRAADKAGMEAARARIIRR